MIINNYGTINMYTTEDLVERAKDRLINRMYYARNSDNVIGGREGWLQLIEMYDCGNYQGMKEFISNCKGRCGIRRQEMLECLDIIIEKGGVN